MEFFLPSVVLLLIAAGVVFFVLPQFGPTILAGVSLVLLVMGIRQHQNMFQAEYRLSTWHLALVNFAPYIMIGGLIMAIFVYLFYIVPTGGSGTTASIENMPSANSATNIVTSSINRALNTVSDVANNVSTSVANTINNNVSKNGIFNTLTGNTNKNGNTKRNTLGFPLSQI